MKNKIKKAVSCILVIIMLFSTASFAFAKTEEIYEHEDNGIGYCIYCEKTLDLAAKCDHICHKDGFPGAVYKVLRIFWMLFRINRVCDCGAVHYGPQDTDSGCIPRTEETINVKDAVSAFNNLMNKVIPKGTYTLKCVDCPKFTVEEAQPQSIESVLNSVLGNILTDNGVVYKVVKGKIVGTNEYVKEYIGKGNSDYALSPDGVASVKKISLANGDSRIIITLVSEDCVFKNGKTTEKAVHHDSCLHTAMDMENIELPSAVTITSSKISYKGAVIDFIVDSNGRVKSLKTNDKFNATVSGAVTESEVKIKGSGELLSLYCFKY